MASVRILHASDLHLSVNPLRTSVLDYISAGMFWDALTSRTIVSSYNPTITYHLAEFVYQNYLYKWPAPIDAVILSGDIATTGLPDDLEVALEFFDGPKNPHTPLWLAPLVPTLAASTDVDAHLTGSGKIPLWLLPGNHDRLRRVQLWNNLSGIVYFAGGTQFDSVFANHWTGRVREYPTVRRGTLTVKIIAADFSLKSPWHFSGVWPSNQYAQGRVYSDVLDELVRVTEL